MIKQMINLNPSERPTFDNLLHTLRGTVFPESFYSFFHNYVSSINELSNNLTSNTPPSTQPTSTPAPATRPGSVASVITVTNAESSVDTLPSDSDQRIERLWADYESFAPYLSEETAQYPPMDVRVDYAQQSSTSKPFQDVLPVELHIPNRDSKLYSPTDGRRRAALHGNSLFLFYPSFITHKKSDGPALIILALITANIRNCSLSSSKVRALDVFLALSCYLTDEAKLDRMIPYIVELLHDEAAVVRSAAVRTLVQVVRPHLFLAILILLMLLVVDARHCHNAFQCCHLS